MGDTSTRKSIRAPNPPVEDSVFKQFRLDGRTVIITGGAGGIGYEIGRGLAEAGANIAIWYHKSSNAAKLAETISTDFGVKTKTYQIDVQDYQAVEATVGQVVKDFGRLDVMIANAGVPSKAGGLDDRIEDWNRVRAIDFDGAYYCLRAAGLVFREQGHGVGIATASMSGHAANVPQEQSCYNACKAGVIHLAKSLAVEWAKWGGRINSVSPGYIDTAISGDCPFEMKEEWYSLTPLRRDADPRELKGIYLYLASDASSYTTGADFSIDGGYTARHLTEVEEKLERAESLIRQMRRSQTTQNQVEVAGATLIPNATPSQSSDPFATFCDFDERQTTEDDLAFTNIREENVMRQFPSSPEKVKSAQQSSTTSTTNSNQSSNGILETPPKDEFEWDEQNVIQNPSPEANAIAEDGEEEQVADGMASLTVNEKEAGYLGVASGAAVLRILGSNVKFRTSRTESSASSRYAPLAIQPDANRHVADSMIDAYFRVYHVSYPIIHEPTFRAQYSEVIPQPHGASWHILVYIVATIGVYTSSSNLNDIDLALFSHAKSMLSFDYLEVGNITLVQALTLISNYQQKRDKPNSGYNYLGLAVRMATGLGLHKEFPGWNISPLKMEIRRRIWWALCVFDVGATITFSRPMVWPYEGVEVAFPLNVTDRDLTANSKTYPPERDEVTPYTAVSTQARFHVSTNDIYSRVISKPFPTAEELLTLDTQLLQPWVAGLPVYFKDDSVVDPRFALPHAVMQWRYRNFRIIMYRPTVIRMALNARNGRDESSPTNIEAYHRCLDDAEFTIRSISNYWTKNEHSRLASWYALYFLFQASLIPCICLRNCPSALEAQAWCEQVAMTLETIRAMAATNTSSGRCYRIIIDLCGQYLTNAKQFEESKEQQFEAQILPANINEDFPAPMDDVHVVTQSLDQPEPIDESPQTQISHLFPMMWPNVTALEAADEVIGDDAWLEFLRAGDGAEYNV